MNPCKTIDESLTAIEKLLNVSITLIDNQGVIRNHDDYALFGKQRQSHKKNMICKLGFCNHKCIGHCRFDLLEKAQNIQSDYFMHRCWKGLHEVVIPLKANQLLLGLLYAGIWRTPGQTKPDNMDLLPDQAIKEYAKLDEFNIRHAHQIGKSLTLVGKGIAAELQDIVHEKNIVQNRRGLIKEFIFKYASNTPSLNQLAKKLNLSASRTSHVVKELYGCSLEELIMQERISRAKNLLHITHLPIGKIAEMVGAPDAFSFSKNFRRMTGQTPTAFRKNALIIHQT